MRPGPVNRQRVVQVKYLHQHHAIEITYDDVYQAIGCLAQVENPKAHPWHEKVRYLRFYVLPCSKSMKYEYFASIFDAKPEDPCPLLANSKTYSHFSHRICEDCFKGLVSSGRLDCYCVGLDGQPESNHTKKQKGKQLKQIVGGKREKAGAKEVEVEVATAKVGRKVVEPATVDLSQEDFNENGYVKRICELEDQLRDSEEDVDAGRDLVSQLTVSHRQAKDEIENARATLLASRMLHRYGTAEIGIKVLGQINTDGWWEECKDRFLGNQEKFGAWQSRVDQLLRNQTFNPIKVVPDGKGGFQNVVDDDDEELTTLRKTYGPLVATAVGVAALELADWNPSGRYNVSMPWDFNANQKASMSQVFQLFVDVLQEKEKEIKEKDKQLKALAPTKTSGSASKRRRGRA
ncbi:hypothetical protein M758_10G038400 [Ceratodon purpureus]|nr:hypothetical protein M758_10G038400 [Ceratodon purpureus]